MIVVLLYDIGYFFMDEYDEKNDFFVDDWFYEDVGVE